MHKRVLAGLLASAALLLTITPVAAKPGGENPLGTCSDSYVAMDTREFARAYPFEWAVLRDHVLDIYGFLDKNGNGKVCVKERSQNATNYGAGYQAQFVEDNKKSGQIVI